MKAILIVNFKVPATTLTLEEQLLLLLPQGLILLKVIQFFTKDAHTSGIPICLDNIFLPLH